VLEIYFVQLPGMRTKNRKGQGKRKKNDKVQANEGKLEKEVNDSGGQADLIKRTKQPINIPFVYPWRPAWFAPMPFCSQNERLVQVTNPTASSSNDDVKIKEEPEVNWLA